MHSKFSCILKAVVSYNKNLRSNGFVQLKKYHTGFCIGLLFASFQIATYTDFENDFVMRKNKSGYEFSIKSEIRAYFKHVVKQYNRKV